ncbi:MAG: integrase core domain-containing protein [Candidatus Nanopelagicales bacterium]|nr:integrase core domain-containing protein [Candidatus Nanopelagicales bacterium]
MINANQRFIRAHCPWPNGNVERFNRTRRTEWAHRKRFDSDDERIRELGGGACRRSNLPVTIRLRRRAHSRTRWRWLPPEQPTGNDSTPATCAQRRGHRGCAIATIEVPLSYRRARADRPVSTT